MVDRTISIVTQTAATSSQMKIKWFFISQSHKESNMDGWVAICCHHHEKALCSTRILYVCCKFYVQPAIPHFEAIKKFMTYFYDLTFSL